MELVLHEFSHSYRVDDTALPVIPLGDIQWTGDENDVACSVLKSRIAYGLKIGARFLGMGDYIDYASPSNRQELRAAKIYDTARKIHDASARALVDELYEKFLAPTKGRWLGLLEGHHFYELSTGVTSDQYLCEKLNAPFLGSCAYVGLRFHGAGARKTSVITAAIWCHHGVGSGVSATAPVQKLEHIAKAFEADVYCLGHMTKQAVALTNRCYPHWGQQGRPPRLLHKSKLLVGTGGFGKGYIESARQGNVPRGTYVEQGMMLPAVLGCPIIYFRPTRKYQHDKDELHVITTVECGGE